MKKSVKNVCLDILIADVDLDASDPQEDDSKLKSTLRFWTFELGLILWHVCGHGTNKEGEGGKCC